LGVTKQGLAAITKTKGNDACHIILRGGKSGPNFDKSSIQQVRQALINAALPPKIIVDCSHGNSNKDHRNQPLVANAIAEQIIAGDHDLFGIMIESNINSGNQKLPPTGPQDLAYGVSITDACIDWNETVQVLHSLSRAVQLRRQNKI